MAKKKIAKKKTVKKKKGSFLVLLVIVVLALIVAGYYYTTSSRKCQIIKADIELMVNKFDEISDEVTSDITFFESDSKYVELSWSTTNKTYISDEGKVTRPIEEDTGDIIVTITMEIKYVGITSLDAYLLSSKVKSLVHTKDVTVKARKLTDLELIQRYLDKVYMPTTFYAKTNFPDTILDASCTWATSDDSVITNTGDLVSDGKAVITLTLTKNSVSYAKDYHVIVKKGDITNTNSYDFTGFKKTSYAGEASFSDIVISNAISDNENIKFKLEDSLAYIKNKNKSYYKNISFNYGYFGDVTTFTKDTKVSLLISNDGINYSLLKEEVLVDKDSHEFIYNFTESNYGYIQILIETEYSNGSRFVYLNSLNIVSIKGEDDIKEELIKILPNKTSGNVVLPFTTPYGGIVSYNSSSIIDKDGFVTKPDVDTDATLDVKVLGFSKDINLSHTIKVVLNTILNPVEVRFIDLSKFGGYNDCGESTYIKYGNYDILIDAGDNYKTTVESVEYVINTYSNDKEIDLLIATHPDSDHIGGMDEIINDYSVLKAIRFSGSADTNIYKNFNDALVSENCEVCTGLDSFNNVSPCKQKIEISEDGLIYLEILNTTFYEASENNARSVVCVLNAYGTRILFTGDADNQGHDIESAYQASVGDIDILKVVHHGTRYGTSLDFLKAVDPEVAIICNGNYLGNKHGHPTYEAISNLYSYDNNMKVYAITGGDSEDCELGTSYRCNVTDYEHDRNGTILITIDNRGYSIESELKGFDIIEMKDTDFYKTRSALGK